MIRAVKTLMKFVAIFIAAVFLARYLVGSGLIRAGLDTSLGDTIYTELRNFFSINGSEDAETLVVSVVLGGSLLLVAVSAWLFAKLLTKYSSKIKNKE
ncbi:hypothetical protein [Pseudomonas syringae]|uniref:hypothetical protein n=2 Tax=Pseudomonas syringae TaxID=317 RepID=UPI000CDB2F90|nr:hypothetical protein [Pseudomonas syringae]POP69248.1 hypothetical protein CXB35_14560 [Pseudomonas syringae]